LVAIDALDQVLSAATTWHQGIQWKCLDSGSTEIAQFLEELGWKLGTILFMHVRAAK